MLNLFRDGFLKDGRMSGPSFFNLQSLIGYSPKLRPQSNLCVQILGGQRRPRLLLRLFAIRFIVCSVTILVVF